MPQVGTCTTTQRRRQERNTSVALRVPTVPTVADSCTAGWVTATDIYLAEIFVNRADQRVYTRGTTGIFELTTAIGQPVHGSTSDRILYTDNTAVPLLTSDSKFTRDAATNYTNIKATVQAGNEAGFEVSATFLGSPSAGLVYSRSSGNQVFFSIAGDLVGLEEMAQMGYIDNTGTQVTLINIRDDNIVIAVNDDGGNDVAIAILDPSGVIIQGKDSGTLNAALTVVDGNAVIGGGTVLMRMRNDGEFLVGIARILVDETVTNLTESSATIFNAMVLATETGDGGKILYSVEADDGTDFQILTGDFTWSVVNKAGTLTFALDVSTQVTALSAGTLTCTITLADAGSGELTFNANADSSLTQTTLKIKMIMFKQYDSSP